MIRGEGYAKSPKGPDCVNPDDRHPEIFLSKKRTTMAKPVKPKQPDSEKPKQAMGRPPYTPSDKDRYQVKTLAAMHIPDYDIAKVMGLSQPTLRKYFFEELERSHIEANVRVAQSLFQQATNKDKPNVSAAIFWLKCKAGWREDGGEVMGKKEMRQAVAKTADQGTDWENLLQ